MVAVEGVAVAGSPLEVPPARVRAARMAAAFESGMRADFERWVEAGRPPLAEFFKEER